MSDVQPSSREEAPASRQRPPAVVRGSSTEVERKAGRFSMEKGMNGTVSWSSALCQQGGSSAESLNPGTCLGGHGSTCPGRGGKGRACSCCVLPPLASSPNLAHPLCLGLSAALNKPVGVGGSAKIAEIQTWKNSCSFRGEKAKLYSFSRSPFPSALFSLLFLLLVGAVFSSNP